MEPLDKKPRWVPSASYKPIKAITIGKYSSDVTDVYERAQLEAIAVSYGIPFSRTYEQGALISMNGLSWMDESMVFSCIEDAQDECDRRNAPNGEANDTKNKV